MNSPRRPMQVTPKIINLYSRLFEGTTVTQICGPNQTQNQFYAELLMLRVDRTFISRELEHAPRDALLGPLKGFLNSWFRACVYWARSSGYEDVKKNHALETLAESVRGVFAKSMSGWENMEVFAGSVTQSDAVFTEFTDMVADILSDSKAPVNTRHLALQLALIYMCGAGQTSLGSYFLRRDFFSTIISFVKAPETGRFTFEAVLLLCVLANFHRSDAARLNPYLRRLSTCDDIEFYKKVNWATNFALNAVVQSYRMLSDDTPQQNLAMGIVSLFSSLRPDKALSATPIDPPKELFKDQPVEAAVALLPIFEMVNMNEAFSSVLSQSISSDFDEKTENLEQPSSPVVLLTVISLSSYILAHASSTGSPRALAYASISLKTLLAFLEASELVSTLFEPSKKTIQLSRQRLPTLPLHSGPRAPVCAMLDCCVLWLRHNLQYKLEVTSHLLSVNIIQRVLWYLRCNRIRLEYNWKDMWAATLGLLNFIATKAQSIITTSELGVLVDETLALLEYALSQSEKILPSPEALHEFIYELIRFSNGIQRLKIFVLEHGGTASSRRTAWISTRSTEERLGGILKTVNYYEIKVSNASAKTAKDAMKVVAKDIESEGLHGVMPILDSEPPNRDEDAVGFIRYGYGDILALMS